ncbi:MAG: OmpH family outer membrane protein [Pirellulaceae bacterium]|jgi:Skp family chaperone for outer membrane proteins|nr:OmpH family outer membrane protein [Pirellulaceae bacterium]
MGREVFLACGLVSLVVAGGSVGRAQVASTASATPATLVAVIDIAKVFESHPTFKGNLESLQQQAQQTEGELETQRQQLNQRNRQLAELRVGSPQYLHLETDLARQMADLQVQARQKKKDLLQREALQYYSVYQEILTAIERIAQRHSIGLVLRYDSRSLNPEDPQSVMLGLQRGVILQRNLDITNLVIDDLRTNVAANSPDRAPRR